VKQAATVTIKFGIVGAGWRSLFFIRIAAIFPERFHCTGVVVRDETKRLAFQNKWKVQTFASLDELLDAQAVDFMVVSTSENHNVILDIVKRNIPCLSETPPARTEDELIRVFESVQNLGGKVQIAEQYHLRPHHQAQMKVLRSGKLGTISQAQCSIAHGYHGISMIRRFLDLGFENAIINAAAINTQLIQGPDRAGLPKEEKLVDAKQYLAWFQFENNTFASLDFSTKHYRSWLHHERVLLRGERGELSDHQVRYLKTFNEPMAFQLERVTQGQEGDLSAANFMGYRAEGEWLYRNPFFHEISNSILMDDEIAVAHCLVKMYDFVHEGQSFYSLAEACQDTYLALLYERSAEQSKALESETQVWAI